MPGRSVVKLRRITSEDLFAGVRELVIVHQGKDYCLRITNKGKLILTA
ncbi:MAG: hemin uptake protein HemP [Betaproteobacteria bacterium]|nr:hemin uptake protein HemP [Betaproteobacteria bacterium]